MASAKDEKKTTCASARAESGVSSAGFTTAVQPIARAAAAFRVIIANGKFHRSYKQVNDKVKKDQLARMAFSKDNC